MKNKLILKIALLSASLLVASAPAINANLPAMIAAFPEVPLQIVEMLTTIPSMFLMISVLTSSFIAKKIGYKQTIVTGLCIVAVAGIIPVVTNNFYIILATRAMLGFGVGLFNSLLVSMISYFYDGEERSGLFGIQSACEGLGGMAVTFIAGRLLTINWQALFYAYLIAIPVVIMFSIFVPKVDTKELLDKINVKKSESLEGKKGDLYPVIGYIGLIFLIAILYMTMGIKVSSLMTSEGYANASDASTVIMLLSLGAMLSGFLFGKIIKVLKDFTLPIAYMILAVAMFSIGISNSVVVTVFGGFVTGFGFRMIMPYFINKINNSSISNTGLATSLLLVGYNLGVFITPYGSIILEYLAGDNGLRGVFYVDAIIFVLLSLTTVLFIVFKKKKQLSMKVKNLYKV
ncbi:MAG: MFS transporter [Coprobacillaceae bacterium]